MAKRYEWTKKDNRQLRELAAQVRSGELRPHKIGRLLKPKRTYAATRQHLSILGISTRAA